MSSCDLLGASLFIISVLVNVNALLPRSSTATVKETLPYQALLSRCEEERRGRIKAEVKFRNVSL